MNKDNAMKLGNFIGGFLQEDAAGDKASFPRKYLRIQVAVNTLNNLKLGCFIIRENGEKLWVTFKYERLPDFYYECGRIDHVAQACLEPPRDKLNDDVAQHCYGPWLRAGTQKQMPSSNEEQLKTISGPKPPPENRASTKAFDQIAH